MIFGQQRNRNEVVRAIRQEVFQEDGGSNLSQEMGDIVDFAIFSVDTQRNHRGRIERVPVHELGWPACESDDGMVVGSHRLWVDDCHIPEYADHDATSTAYYPDYYQVFVAVLSRPK